MHAKTKPLMTSELDMFAYEASTQVLSRVFRKRGKLIFESIASGLHADSSLFDKVNPFEATRQNVH